MSRDASGNYSLPAAYNPVVTLTKIRSAWANTTLADIAGEITNSLDRSGRGAMLAELKAYSGSSLQPGVVWDSETTSGWYRASAGVFRHAIGNVDGVQIDVNGVSVYDEPSGTAYRVGFREIVQRSKSANYTLTIADAGCQIYHPNSDASARVFTIPANASVAFPIGAAITFLNDAGAGALTIAITSDTLVLCGTGATGSRTLAASGCATAVKVASTRWMISGTNLS